MVLDGVKSMLYIVRFLHQTTTSFLQKMGWTCCISPVPYIKPQPFRGGSSPRKVVYRPFPTSNHNEQNKLLYKQLVVYRPFPTSNHNLAEQITSAKAVVYRPFPTSNHNVSVYHYVYKGLYIVRFLHQTTTVSSSPRPILSCISSVSYIKPQRNC